MISKISKKGQVVIPKEIRDKLNILPGDAIIFKIDDNKIIIERIGEKLTDILKSSKPINYQSIEFQHKIRDEWI